MLFSSSGVPPNASAIRTGQPILDGSSTGAPDPVICDPWVGHQGEPMVTTMADYKARYDADHVESKLRVELSLTKTGNRVYGSAEAPT
jgi:hypothetical protein